MESKKTNTTLIILLIFAMLIICLLLGYIILGNKNNAISNNTNEITEEKENQKIDITGKYVLTYKDEYENLKNDYVPSYITFNDNNTFTFIYNMCSNMTSVSGKYEVSESSIKLTDLFSYDQESLVLHTGGKKELYFKFITIDEIYFDWDDPYGEDMFACTHTGTKYSTFIKE